MKNHALSIYNQIDKNTITTTDVIKTSFKVVFDKLENDEFVIIDNSRKNKKLVMVSLDDYTTLLDKLEAYEEIRFDNAAAEYVSKGKHKFIDASKAGI